ncbi:MAG TPA: Ig-like domain-containing protein, partial [Solirubrobacteraceae bacterium]|nr:Ig-like domain-containing protein [Solirubrobacteraceae bacterium]
MVEAGSPTPARSWGAGTVAATLLALLLVLLAVAPSAHAITRDAAAKKALAALGTENDNDPVIVFGLRGTLRPRTVIGQSAPSGGSVRSRGRGAFGRARTKRIKRAGALIARADVIMRVGAEPAFFFFEDRGPHQAFEHPGRVALVGARTGRVRMSDTTRWVPLIDGRQPAFFRNAANYESKRYRVLSRPWTTPEARRARTRQAPDTSPRQLLADALAAERSCAFRISDTMGDFFDFGRVDQTRARLGLWFEGLEKLNAGFVSRRYTTKEGQTPTQAAQALIDEAGCRDLFLYTAGAAPRVGEEGIVIGMRPRPGGLIEWHVLTAAELEALVQANPAVTFKFFFDVPYSRVNDDLIDEPNTVVLLSSGGPGESSFTFLPEVLGPNGIQGNPGNPYQLLEFTNAIITGFEAFVNNPAEMAHGLANQPGSGISMMSWMLARAMALSPAWIFSAPLDLIKLPDVPGPGGPPAPPAPPPPPPELQAAPNRAPRGTTPAQPTDEDTPRAITLTATDPDGDPLTFTITDQPDHGDLTGTPPNLTYTPDQDFDGDDAFTYQVSDGRGGTDTQTVQIPITPDNDAAAVTTTSGGSAAFTEDGSPVVVDGGLTIADPDSAQLEGATVSIASGFQSGDELVFVDQSGITGTYNTGTGVLTLTGNASVSDYQAALRSVQFDSSQQNPTTSRTVQFVAEDGDEAGVPASRGVTITPVNDAAVGATNETTALAYTEGAGATEPFPNATITDVDDTMIEGATIAIVSGYQSGEDFLAFSDQNGITGAAFNTSTGSLSLSGTATIEQYRDAIRSVTYENTSDNPDTTQRVVTFTVSDGDANSAGVLRGIDVTRANDAPVVTTTAGSTSYSEGDPGTVIDGGLTVSDVDDTNLEGATVRVSSGFESGDDLTFVNTANISGTYNTGTGVLTLTGTDTVANYQAALRSVTFDNTVDDNLQAKTVEFTVDDGDADSAAATKTIAITAVNDNPTLDTTNTAVSYAEDSGPVAVDPGIAVTDPDSANLGGAVVQITSNHVQADDDLAFVDTPNISGAYNDSTGVLTLTGTDTLANYQAALRSVTYENVNDNPSGSKTVSFQVDDGGAVDNLSNVPTRDINLTAANDAPVVTT